MTNRRVVRRRVQMAPETILEDLTRRQFLHPHHSLSKSLDDASHELGFCPKAAETALGWLQLEPSLAIGRFRRTELIQLSRSIHRFWQRSTSEGRAQNQPA